MVTDGTMVGRGTSNDWPTLTELTCRIRIDWADGWSSEDEQPDCDSWMLLVESSHDFSGPVRFYYLRWIPFSQSAWRAMISYLNESMPGWASSPINFVRDW